MEVVLSIFPPSFTLLLFQMVLNIPTDVLGKLPHLNLTSAHSEPFNPMSEIPKSAHEKANHRNNRLANHCLRALDQYRKE